MNSKNEINFESLYPNNMAGSMILNINKDKVEARFIYENISPGEYAVIFAAAPHEGCLSYWQQLAGFAKSAGFSAAGCAYRSIPVEMGISRREDDYVSKLFFPIKRI